ncbi:E3 ubiquitin-protein ligase RNF12-B isoform X2 [Drosophila subpulchrella]|uniref:E3 ubiquitin-protein ligase RNF12-B isoform X2 n=1 Tax=Drosophila subpulchrella TaxID=1486046 RepID=UPI0018A1A84C|nr:E3 ubiquitin-protein ligase RNF12-B isoform X2 [Drosophila subpulchrella]
MKFSAALALLLIAGIVASGDALPARKRMVYLQQPAAAEWYGSAPQQRFMYMQYVQPGRTHARSTQAASALVAGETVATGTYLKESEISAEGVQADDALAAAGAHGASSVAEAFPDQAPVVQVAIDADVVPEPQAESEADPEPETADDAAKVPRDFNFAAEEAAVAPAAEEEPAALPVAEAELPVPAPIAPVASVVPANRYLPAKKKVIVELDQEEEEPQAAAIEDEEEAENAVADDVEEDEDELSVPVKPIVPNARRPAARKPVKAAAPAGGKPSKKPAAPLPAGTFFPIDFGGTNGGAIAIANSFSTGEGGSATSHAIAYGSPESAVRRARPNPSKFRH